MSDARMEKANPPGDEEDPGFTEYLMGDEGGEWVWLLVLLTAW